MRAVFAAQPPGTALLSAWRQALAAAVGTVADPAVGSPAVPGSWSVEAVARMTATAIAREPADRTS